MTIRSCDIKHLKISARCIDEPEVWSMAEGAILGTERLRYPKTLLVAISWPRKAYSVPLARTLRLHARSAQWQHSIAGYLPSLVQDLACISKSTLHAGGIPLHVQQPFLDFLAVAILEFVSHCWKPVNDQSAEFHRSQQIGRQTSCHPLDTCRGTQPSVVGITSGRRVAN